MCQSCIATTSAGNRCDDSVEFSESYARLAGEGGGSVFMLGSQFSCRVFGEVCWGESPCKTTFTLEDGCPVTVHRESAQQKGCLVVAEWH